MSDHDHALHLCLADGDLRGARQALALGADPDAVLDGRSALNVASLDARCEALVKMLADAGASAARADGDGVDALEWACSRGLWIAAAALCSCPGASIATRHSRHLDRHGANLATALAALDQAGSLRRLVAECPGAARWRNANGADPFWHACESRSVACAELLARFCDIDWTYQDGSAPLHAAAKLGAPEPIRALLGRRPRLRAVDHDGRGAMHWAIQSGSPEAVWLLAEAGAPLRELDALGRDPLALGALLGQGPARSALLAAIERMALAEDGGEESGSARRGRL